MDVKIIGFEIKTARGFEFGKFYQELERYEKKKVKNKKLKYIYFVDLVGDLVVGLGLFFKDPKSLISADRGEETEISEELLVDIEKLKGTKEPVDPIIWVLNPGTQRGLFYKAANSASLDKLKVILKKSHDSYISSEKREYKKELTELGRRKPNRTSDEVEAKFGGKLELSTLVTQKDLDQIISELEVINTINVFGVMAAEISNGFGPLRPFSNKGKTSINIDKKSNYELLKQRVKDIFNGKVGRSTDSALSLIGETVSGEERTLKVGENLDFFGNLDFEEFVDSLPQDKWSNYKDSDAVKVLLDKVRNDRHKFGDIQNADEWKLMSAKDLEDGM